MQCRDLRGEAIPPSHRQQPCPQLKDGSAFQGADRKSKANPPTPVIVPPPRSSPATDCPLFHRRSAPRSPLPAAAPLLAPHARWPRIQIHGRQACWPGALRRVLKALDLTASPVLCVMQPAAMENGDIKAAEEGLLMPAPPVGRRYRPAGTDDSTVIQMTSMEPGPCGSTSVTAHDVVTLQPPR